jgi:acyl-coenzyme A thioesterase PaaI-like protein
MREEKPPYRRWHRQLKAPSFSVRKRAELGDCARTEMAEADRPLDVAEMASYLSRLAFIREYGIKVVTVTPGAVIVELPFNDRFSGPPSQFPASMVGTIGDVAAVSSCLSLLPKGWGIATIDFTVKMTGVAKGEGLRAKGRTLQNGRSISVGAADVYAVNGNEEFLCGTVLASTRNFEIRGP